MSPANAEIVIIEDDFSVIETVKEFLEMAGHSILHIVRSRQELTQLLEKPIFSNVEKAVFLVDGNLSELDSSGRDGRWSVGQIRSVYTTKPPLVIGRSLRDDVEGADEQATKLNVGSGQLGAFIDAL